MSFNTAKNLEHWNEASKTYDSKFSKTIQQIMEEIQARKDWIGVDWVDEDEENEQESSSKPKKVVRLLDYACGTGLVSRALASSVTQTIGIDLTPGMASAYNTAASNQGIPTSEMHAVVGNLIDVSTEESPAHLSGPEFYDFDIVVVGLGFHHFDDPALAARRLAARLKKGGVLVVIDFLPHGGVGGHGGEGHSHGHGHSHDHGHGHGHGHSHGHNHGEKAEKPHAAAHTVTHHGFSEAQIKSMFEAAGVGEGFDYVTVGKGIVFTSKGNGEEGVDGFEEGEREGEGEVLRRSVFMARGVKA